jgi:hypothetical protein
VVCLRSLSVLLGLSVGILFLGTALPVHAQERAESMDNPPGSVDDLRSRVQQWASNM